MKSLGDDINTVPVISLKNIVYVTTDDDCLYALDLVDGRRRWKFEAEDVITAGFTLSKDETMIFLAAGEGTIYALNIEGKTPKVQWKKKVNGAVQAPIVHDFLNKIIYLSAVNDEDAHSHGHDIYGINVVDGSTKFTFRVHEAIAFPFYIADHILYVLTFNHGFLYEYDRITGASRMPYKTGMAEPSDAFPAIDLGHKKMYFGLQAGGIGQINLENRKLDFTDPLDGRRILTAITLCSDKTNQELYFGTKDEIVKYDMGKRKLSWAVKFDSMPGAGAPVLDNTGSLLVRFDIKSILIVSMII